MDVAFHVGRSPALCASIAHEIRQPLTAIIANASACRRWLAASPPNHERAEIAAERILEDALWASETIGGLLALFTQRNGVRAPVQINDVVREACALVLHEGNAGKVEISLTLDPTLPALTVDRVQIRQLLINLIHNGIEAMETSPGPRRLEVLSRRHAGGVQVEVCDGGTGVLDAERIFDALFSTKEHGMGIGLALCRQIVEAHGGHLWPEPGQARGTRMIFTLPDRGGWIDPSVAPRRLSPPGSGRHPRATLHRLAAAFAAIAGFVPRLATLAVRLCSARFSLTEGANHRLGAPQVSMSLLPPAN